MGVMCSKPGGGTSQYNDGFLLRVVFLDPLSRDLDRLRSRDLSLSRDLDRLVIFKYVNNSLKISII